MSELVRSLSEGVARRSDRRSFLGKIARSAFVGAAAIVVHSSLANVAAGCQGCHYPNGTSCLAYNSSFCDYGGDCAGGCSRTSAYGYPGGCWSDDCGFTCCDCSCPGYADCGCRANGLRPVGQGDVVSTHRAA